MHLLYGYGDDDDDDKTTITMAAAGVGSVAEDRRRRSSLLRKRALAAVEAFALPEYKAVRDNLRNDAKLQKEERRARKLALQKERDTACANLQAWLDRVAVNQVVQRHTSDNAVGRVWLEESSLGNLAKKRRHNEADADDGLALYEIQKEGMDMRSRPAIGLFTTTHQFVAARVTPLEYYPKSVTMNSCYRVAQDTTLMIGGPTRSLTIKSLEATLWAEKLDQEKNNVLPTIDKNLPINGIPQLVLSFLLLHPIKLYTTAQSHPNPSK
jgi:hypothetical protein